MERPGRNDPCPCGSGRKYKRCCLPHEAERAAFGAVLEADALPLLSRLARFAERAAAAPLETIAREEFPFWHGRLDRAQGARIVDFLMFEFRPKHVGRRTVEQFAIENGPTLELPARGMLERWTDASRRLYRVDEWSGGFTTCVDLLAEHPTTVEVFDVEGTWRPAAGEPVALRPLPVGSFAVCTGRPMGFGGRPADEVAVAMRRRHLDFVRTTRIVSLDDFLRAAPKALDEEATVRAGSSGIILPGA